MGADDRPHRGARRRGPSGDAGRRASRSTTARGPAIHAGGEVIRPASVISSLPLRTTVAIADPVAPQEVRDAAFGLRYRDFLTVALVLEGEDIFPDNWIYIHEADVNVGRIQNYRSWSPWMVPDPDTACVGLEYFVFEGDEMWTSSDDDLVALATHELEQLGLAKAARSCAGTSSASRRRIRCTTPSTPTACRRSARGWTASPGLQQVGRNGLHRYNNSDHSMLSAMRAVDNVLDVPATTSGRSTWRAPTTRSRPTRTRRSPTATATRRSPTRCAPRRTGCTATRVNASARSPSSAEHLSALSLRREAEAERAPGAPGRDRSSRLPPWRSASSRPIASPSPKPPSPPLLRPRWKRSKMRSSSSAGTPTPTSEISSVASDPWYAGSTATSVPGGAKRSALSRRMRIVRATAPGSPRAQQAPGGGSTWMTTSRVRARCCELRGDGPRDLRELGRLGAHRRLGVEAREVQQVGREVREAVDLALGQLDLAQHVLAVDVAVREILAEQLQRPAQGRQRRAQLVRRRRDEGTPRALLAVERGLHRRQRAGEVADLVAALVARRARAGALPRDRSAAPAGAPGAR